MRNTAYVDRSFHNITNVAPGRGVKLQGYSRSDRVFRVYGPTRSRKHWLARAVEPRDGQVNEITGPTLASIANQLDVTP